MAEAADVKLEAQTTREVPNLIVEVLPGNTANVPDPHGGPSLLLHPGHRFETEGPTAIALVQAGHVKIVGSVDPNETATARDKRRRGYRAQKPPKGTMQG